MLLVSLLSLLPHVILTGIHCIVQCNLFHFGIFPHLLFLLPVFETDIINELKEQQALILYSDLHNCNAVLIFSSSLIDVPFAFYIRKCNIKNANHSGLEITSSWEKWPKFQSSNILIDSFLTVRLYDQPYKNEGALVAKRVFKEGFSKIKSYSQTKSNNWIDKI